MFFFKGKIYGLQYNKIVLEYAIRLCHIANSSITFNKKCIIHIALNILHFHFRLINYIRSESPSAGFVMSLSSDSMWEVK